MTARRRSADFSWESYESKPEPGPSCPVSGKRMYDTEGEAKSTAAHRMADKQTGPAHLSVYRCLYCDSWHLTSRDSAAKRRDK
jgi:hypothetical protein